MVTMAVIIAGQPTRRHGRDAPCPHDSTHPDPRGRRASAPPCASLRPRPAGAILHRPSWWEGGVLCLWCGGSHLRGRSERGEVAATALARSTAHAPRRARGLGGRFTRFPQPPKPLPCSPSCPQKGGRGGKHWPNRPQKSGAHDDDGRPPRRARWVPIITTGVTTRPPKSGWQLVRALA